jgi:molybdopterin converting factor subunit 1
MRCTVLLFAQLAEALGRCELPIELPAGATVEDALRRLASEHAAIDAMRGRLAAAVNDAYAPASRRLAEGDRLALIPPVSGG